MIKSMKVRCTACNWRGTIDSSPQANLKELPCPRCGAPVEKED